MMEERQTYDFRDRKSKTFSLTLFLVFSYRAGYITWDEIPDTKKTCCLQLVSNQTHDHLISTFQFQRWHCRYLTHQKGPYEHFWLAYWYQSIVHLFQVKIKSALCSHKYKLLKVTHANDTLPVYKHRNKVIYIWISFFMNSFFYFFISF